MKKTHITLMICALISVPVIAAEYIIKVDTGVELTGEWTEVSSTATEWVADGGLTNCLAASEYPQDKIDGETYSHAFNCDQNETQVVTTLLENVFSGQTKTENTVASRTVTKSQLRSISVQMSDFTKGDLYDCDAWSHASNQNADVNVLDQVRECLEPTTLTLSHGYDGVLVYEQSNVVRSESVVDTQSIGRSNASCKTLLVQDSRLSSATYQLASGGAYCDMATKGGGWTQIAHVVKSGVPTVSPASLNDKGISYSEVLYEDHGSYNDFAAEAGSWGWRGYDLGKNVIRVGGKWRAAQGKFQYGYEGCTPVADADRLPVSSFEILSASSMCQHSSTSTSDCGNAVIIQMPTGQRIDAIGDAESVSQRCHTNNSVSYNFKIFVR